MVLPDYLVVHSTVRQRAKRNANPALRSSNLKQGLMLCPPAPKVPTEILVYVSNAGPAWKRLGSKTEQDLPSIEYAMITLSSDREVLASALS